MKYILILLSVLVSTCVVAQVDAQSVDTLLTKTAPSFVSLNGTAAKRLFSQVSNVTVQNYTLNTPYNIKGVMGTNDTDTLKASLFTLGKTCINFLDGLFTTPTLNVGTITVTLSLGSDVVMTSTFSSLPVGVTSGSYQAKVTLVMRQNSVYVVGYINYTNLGILPNSTITQTLPPTIVPIDWTTDKLYKVSVQYTTPGNTLISMGNALYTF